MTSPLTIAAAHERFAIEGGFAISRGSRTHADVVTVSISRGGLTGRGECVPYARYGESIASVMQQIEEAAARFGQEISRTLLQAEMEAGAARNALDCALWDLEAKTAGTSAAALAGLASMKPLVTAYTLSVGTPESMGAAAAKAASRPLLKVKLAGAGDDERITAVRAAAPDARLIVDANEAWDESCFAVNMAACVAAAVELIEQPLPAGNDGLLASAERPIAVCADESLHTRHELASLRQLYDAVNIKLDKAGGLTEALALAADARALGYKIMTGCMLGTSLGMAPALLVAQTADFVDLDGPLLLTADRDGGLTYEGSLVYPPEASLWG